MYKNVHLVGTGEAGTWVILARARAGDEVTRSIADLNGFAFSRITRMDDPMLLPGALKYGGIGGIAAVGVPRETYVFSAGTLPPEEFAGLEAVNKAARGYLVMFGGGLSDEKAVRFLLKYGRLCPPP